MTQTAKQELGDVGEAIVVKRCRCWKCGRARTLKKLAKNFKCADVICDFCGALSQVKAKTTDDVSVLPNEILGAAWGPQKARMDEGIFFTLYLVLKNAKKCSVWILKAEDQSDALFKPRKPLSINARRAGWQGFVYKLEEFKNKTKRLI